MISLVRCWGTFALLYLCVSYFDIVANRDSLQSTGQLPSFISGNDNLASAIPLGSRLRDHMCARSTQENKGDRRHFIGEGMEW
jgi:hypothetical protein